MVTGLCHASDDEIIGNMHGHCHAHYSCVASQANPGRLEVNFIRHLYSPTQISSTFGFMMARCICRIPRIRHKKIERVDASTLKSGGENLVSSALSSMAPNAGYRSDIVIYLHTTVQNLRSFAFVRCHARLIRFSTMVTQPKQKYFKTSGTPCNIYCFSVSNHTRNLLQWAGPFLNCS